MGIGWPVVPREVFIHRAPFAITMVSCMRTDILDLTACLNIL